MAEGDLASTLGLFLSNLEKEAGTPIGDQNNEHQGRPAGRRRRGRGQRRAARRGEVVLLRRVGLPRRRLQAALVPRAGAPARRGQRDYFDETLREHAVAGQRDAQAVRAAEAGDVPQDQEAARRRGVRPRRRDRLRDRAQGRPQLHRQDLLAPQQDRARRRRGVPARHERLDRRGDREAQAEVHGRRRLRRRPAQATSSGWRSSRARAGDRAAEADHRPGEGEHRALHQGAGDDRRQLRHLRLLAATGATTSSST